MADEFLKKVYDRYMDSDYTYGMSNLNPRREISKISLINPSETEDEILAKIRAKIKEIDDIANKLDSYKSNSIDDNNNFITDSGPKRNMSLSKQQAILYSGGKSSLIFVPGNSSITDDNGISPLEDQIQELILRLTPYIGILPNDNNGNGDNSDPNKTKNPFDEFGLPTLYIVNCSEALIDDSFGAGDAESDADGLLNTIGGDGNGNGDDNDQDDNNGDGGDGNGNGDDGNGNGDDGGDSGNGDNDDLNDNDTGGTNLDDTVNALEDAANESQEQLVNCAMMSLTILQVLLMLLKVVSMLKKILIMVMNIIVPIIKIAVRIAQCWINPPSLQEALQMVMEKLEAIAMQLISMILQAIWDSLGLDCLISIAQSLLDQINAAIAGIESLYNGVTKLIEMTGEARKQVVEPLSSLKDIASKGKENWKAFANEFKKDENGKNGFLETMKNSAFSDPLSMLKNSIPGSITSAYTSLITNTMTTFTNIKQVMNEAKGKATGLSSMAARAIGTLDDAETL